MATDTHIDSSFTAANHGRGTSQFARRALAAVTSFVRSLQTARMISTLSGMSDYQLAQLGIKRAGIRQYADHLMAHDAK